MSHSPAQPRARQRRLALLLFVAAIALTCAPWPLAGASTATPTVALDPESGSCATRSVARGTGFPSGMPVRVYSGGDDGPIRGRGAAGADGTFAITLDALCNPAASPPVGSRLTVTAATEYFRGVPYIPLQTSTTFTVAAAAPPPVLILVPNSGPCHENNRVFARGAGLQPGRALQLRSVRSAPVRGDKVVEVGQVTVAADGTFALSLASVGCDPADPPGTQYTVSVAGIEPPPSAVFTVGTLGERCFVETGFCIKERFLDYWQAHGLDLGDYGISERESLALFGYPLSGEFVQRLEDGKEYTVQYFERARFEHHPENAAPYDVLLGQFGRRILTGMPGTPTAPVPASSRPGTTYFPETGHNVGPDFSLFWVRNGGLAVFGYPLSEPFTQQLEDGKTYTVQYFERARFEDHLAGEGMPYNVQLGHFGRRILTEMGGGR